MALNPSNGSNLGHLALKGLSYRSVTCARLWKQTNSYGVVFLANFAIPVMSHTTGWSVGVVRV